MLKRKNSPKRAAEESADVPKGTAKRGAGMKKTAVITVACVLAVALAVGYGMLCSQVREGVVLPKTVVNDVELSGMTAEEAEQALTQAFHAKYDTAERKVAIDGEEYTVSLGDTLSLDAKAAAEELLSVNQRPFLLRGASMLKAVTVGTKETVLPSITDTDKLAENLQASGLMDINTTVQTKYQVNDEGNLDIHMGVTGHSVDEAALTEQLNAGVAEDDYESVIECPVVTGEVKALNWKKLNKKIVKKPVDATLKLSDDRRSFEMVESITGVSYNQDEAKSSVEAAQEGEVVTIPLTYTEPEITTQNLEDNLFQDLLADYETVVKGSDGRKSNVRLACQKCTGIILLPGDSMGYNETLGQRTAENGFYPAPAYFNGEVVQEYGGGICQVSSTLYCATLYANLQIDERHNHTFASTYVPLGLDATVSWEGPDFVFTNNRKYPIKLEVDYYQGNACVRIWGTKTDDVKVKMVSDTLETKPYSTETHSDSSRYVGESYTEQHGMDGYLVQTYRVLVDGDGNEISKTKEAYSDYEPEKEIVYVGTKEKPKPKPQTTTPATDNTAASGTGTDTAAQ